MAATPTGNGYWMVATDGGVFPFGDAPFWGSTGGTHVDSPIIGIAPTTGTSGYWLSTEDGTVYQFQGSSTTVAAHDLGGNLATGIVSTPSGAGYWLVDLGANVYPTGDAVTYPLNS
jgi:hypothetical protein